MSDQHPHAFTREQKTGFALLFVFGILTIGLGFLQMRNTIYSPYVVRLEPAEQDDIRSILNDDEVRLQSIDTDQDGINNYEELYFYNTSPYLKDTDSDGVNDKEEIDAGENPICPIGDVCEGADAAGERDLGGLLGDPGEAPVEPTNNPLYGNTVNANPQTQGELDAILNDADAIRQMLLQSGQLSETQLRNISDKELLALVADIVDEQSPGAEVPLEASPEVPAQ